MAQKRLILRMKAARKEKGMTYTDIELATERMGTPVSLSSVKRVFAEGSENRDFRDETTLIPIARILLDPEEIREILKVENEMSEINYQVVVQMKEEMIDVLNRQIENIQQDSAKKVEYLKKEIARSRTIIRVLAIALAVLAAAVVAVLVYDKTNPNVGWFRGEDAFGGSLTAVRTFVRLHF